jgi:hypothetical protein
LNLKQIEVYSPLNSQQTMILRLLFSGLLLFTSAIIVAQQTNTAQFDWEQYLNATFLPPGHPKATAQLNSISDPVLRQSAHTAQNVPQQNAQKDLAEVTVMQTESARSSKSAEKKETAAAAAEMDDVVAISPAINLPALISAAETGTSTENKKALYKRYKDEFPLHSTAYGYGKNVLTHLPPSAILIVQGQLDAYPILAEQNLNNTRTDVVVINLNWLSESVYRTKITQQLALNPNWKAGETTQTMLQKLVSLVPTRVHLAMTVDRNILRQFENQLNPMGLVFAMQPVSAQKHHQILAQFKWDEVQQPNLPEYIKALHANYLAALLIDEKQKQPVSLGNYNRSDLLKNLYSQTGLKTPAEKFLKN